MKIETIYQPTAQEVQQENVVVLTMPDGSDMPIAKFNTYEEAREYLSKCWLGTMQLFKAIV